MEQMHMPLGGAHGRGIYEDLRWPAASPTPEVEGRRGGRTIADGENMGMAEEVWKMHF